ncbi:hypothetical protein SAMN02745116_01265 [Pilibacter termitis]|uniref:UPF0178 protein SAMN02745116_01265 n=1 Tax=Pilibacter termitis TaxID=263852 RepID=A0A1T4MZ80_9ENTE|nr:YaiI/YqxD family protein [Pilibacter termitis]SJZ72369.1 hypothetical protein SAMN02745116_01265 [Pilibacter termitis]
MRKIVIDGDGSPVKEDVFRIAEAFGEQVLVVTSVDHYSTKKIPEYVEMVYVDAGADSADFRIVQLIQAGDILVTQDYGLASLVLPKGARVLHQLGFEYTTENIDGLLANRYFGQLTRAAGKRTKGPKPFTKENHDEFQQKLIELLQEETSKV